MRIALIAPPFIEIPPKRYGGTELFIANLARELHRRGHEITVYANGDSDLPCRVKWRYRHAEWPLEDPLRPQLKNADHSAWAIHDAATAGADVIHLNDAVGVPFTLFTDQPAVMTIHHPHEPALSELYLKYPRVHYVAIADWLAGRESMPRLHVVPHGLPLADYVFSDEKDDYVAFLGRMAPCKGPHLAIEAARLAGVPIKLAGEVQPVFSDYWNSQVLPQIDGRQVEYIGEADRVIKNQLLSRARALLFPIQWEEPFGLVMIEAMACGTPVLALPGGAVHEVVRDGVNGRICRDIRDIATRIADPGVLPSNCRDYVEAHFSVTAMADRYLAVYERAVREAQSERQPKERSDERSSVLVRGTAS
jgi:glycosyltransferase involved in cell wall biosynthesis